MEFDERMKLLIKSIKLNYIFLTTYFFLIIFLTLNYGKHSSFLVNLVNGCLTLIIAFIYGWFIHFISHHNSYVKDYKKMNLHKYLKKK